MEARKLPVTAEFLSSLELCDRRCQAIQECDDKTRTLCEILSRRPDSTFKLLTEKLRSDASDLCDVADKLESTAAELENDSILNVARAADDPAQLLVSAKCNGVITIEITLVDSINIFRQTLTGSMWCKGEKISRASLRIGSCST